jgi:hypothetical protein
VTTARVRQLPPLPPRPDDRPAPTPSPARRGRGTAALLLVLVLAGVSMSAWHWLVTSGASAAGSVSKPSTGRPSSTSSQTPTVRVTERVLITVRPTLPTLHASVSQPPPTRRPIVTYTVPAKRVPAQAQSSVAKRLAPSPIARTASASFTLTCPVATTLTATGSGVGNNTLSLTGLGLHRVATGARPSFTVQVQAGSFTATDTDTGGQPSVGLRQSVPASEACHP